jgi:hypothetical protein
MRAWSALRSIAACNVGIRNRPAWVPSPLSVSWRYVLRTAARSSAFEPTRLRLVGGVRVDDLVQPARQASEAAGVVLTSQVHQVHLGALAVGGVHAGWEVVHAPDGDPRLVGSTAPSVSASWARSTSASRCPGVLIDQAGTPVDRQANGPLSPHPSPREPAANPKSRGNVIAVTSSG